MGSPQRLFWPASAQQPIYGGGEGGPGGLFCVLALKGLREPSTRARGERRPTTTSDDLIPSGLFKRSHGVHHQRGARYEHNIEAQTSKEHRLSSAFVTNSAGWDS